MASKTKSQAGAVTLLLLLFGSLIALIVFLLRKTFSNPSKLIIEKLTAAGYSEEMARYWIAVSKFETANYTSSLYRNAHNLFGMGYPTVGKDYGSVMSDEGLKSKYPDDATSVDDLVEYLQGFHYPLVIDSLLALVKLMKSKGYFTADLKTYYNGVTKYAPNMGGGGKTGGHGSTDTW